MKVDYSKAFIYKLCCLDPKITECYVGCSTNFKNRVQSHKRRCCNENDSKHHYKVYQFIRAHGGWDNWRLVVLHDFPCTDKRELEKEETRVMVELKAELNARVSFTTKEEISTKKIARNRERYNEDPKYREKMREKSRLYREKNKESIVAQQKVYQEKNKEAISEKRKEKVQCKFCMKFLRKNSLPRHQRTAAYCIEIQNAK